MATRIARGFGQHSGVAAALERVGERWALLIVRDLLVGARRYNDLKASLPRIPTNILSDRLRDLQDAGVIRRVPVVRGGYELTDLGRGLENVIVELERWGWAASESLNTVVTSNTSADAVIIAFRAAFRQDAAAKLPATEYLVHVGDVSIDAVVAEGHLEITPVGPGALPQPRQQLLFKVPPSAILELVVDPILLGTLLISGPDAAGAIMRAGSDTLIARFAETFRIDPINPGKEIQAAAAA